MRARVVAVPAAILLSLSAAALSLTGCGKTTVTGSSSLSNSGVNASASPDTSASPDVNATTTPTSTTTSGSGGNGSGGGGKTTAPPKPRYGTSAQEYVKITINAWATKSPLLADYTSAGGAVEFANLGKADTHWHFHKCMPDGLYTSCAFDNNNGDELTVTIDPTLIGKAHAARNAVIDRTTYPNDAEAMVGELINAWQNGNYYRVARLSGDATVKQLKNDPNGPPSGTQLSSDDASDVGHTLVTVYRYDNGENINFIVTNSKLGHAYAVEFSNR